MKSFDHGGNGSPLHFLHANGYPPECYRPLLDLLKSEYRIFGMTLRPLWEGAKPEEIQSWHPFSDDLIRFLSDGKSGFDTPSATQPSPVIGVGHSIGATVTLRAALRDPNQFRALVLIEPVLFVPNFMKIWHIIRMLGLGDRFHPLIAGAKRRRRIFDDLETVFHGYRNRHVFRYMSDESLQAYIHGITKPKADGNGYELVFPPEWEAQIYRTNMHDSDIWHDLPKLEIPTLIIRGAETDTFLERTAKFVKRKQPKVRIEALEKSTHLLPLERPMEVFEIMHSFLQETLKVS
jgi:pimeloyl-ACP methyl ester carboxylesterase